MWIKGVFGLLFLVLVDLPAFSIHQKILDELERTSLFYVTALPSYKEPDNLNIFSVMNTHSKNNWGDVIHRYKRQDEPPPEDEEEEIIEDEDSLINGDSELGDEETEQASLEESQIGSDDLVVEEESNLDNVEEQAESSGNGEELPGSSAEGVLIEESDGSSDIESEAVNEEIDETASVELESGSDDILDDSYYANMDAEEEDTLDGGEEEETTSEIESEAVNEEIEETDSVELESGSDDVLDDSYYANMDAEEEDTLEGVGEDNVDPEEDNLDGLDNSTSLVNSTETVQEEVVVDDSKELTTELDEDNMDESDVETTLESPIEVTTTPTPIIVATTLAPIIPCTNGTFGCCEGNEYNHIAAHGPRQEGCCLKTEFLCCPDFLTPAKGPNYEGCDCGETEFGCCENPTEDGSEVVDDDAVENEDNSTSSTSELSMEEIRMSSRDDSKKGCGCLLSPHGCCPDQYTVANGPNVATDCPCDTQAYGCCPDGITTAQGPHLEGCKRCEDTEFGCCPDTITPSSESDITEGCGCPGSQFGCCPDGVSLASGDNFTGCDEIPGEECHLPKDIGTCINQRTFKQNYTRRWFFNLDFGACSPFYWSGDCESGNSVIEEVDDEQEQAEEDGEEDGEEEGEEDGEEEGEEDGEEDGDEEEDEEEEEAVVRRRRNVNEFKEKKRNNFLGLKSCKSKCVNPDGSGRCYLPKVVGPGRAALQRWYYDIKHDQCTDFTYGGLLGNTNNFQSKKECESVCKRSVKELDLCLQPLDPGPCRGKYSRWFYDGIVGSCQLFNYTGCMGNTNRFTTKENCENSCKHHSKKVFSKIICSKNKPTNDGYCTEEDLKAKWYFNKEARLCEPFYYGNCRPTFNSSRNVENENVFDSQDKCENTCPNTFPPEIIISRKNITIEVEQDATFRISVNSNPPSQITWEFEGESVEIENAEDASVRSIEQMLDGSLRITKVALSDTGTWTVIANNDVGSIARKNIFMEVTPERTNITMTLDKAKTSFIAGTSITLSCSAEGFPTPVVKWFKNNTPLKSSQKVNITDSNLIILRSKSIDKGTYKCTASNEHESVSDEVVVTIEEPQGDNIQICEDNPSLANCDMVVKANWCFVGEFPEICCKSCTEAGATPPPPDPTPSEPESPKIEPPEESTVPLTEVTEELETLDSTDESKEQEVDIAVEESEASGDVEESEVLEDSGLAELLEGLEDVEKSGTLEET